MPTNSGFSVVDSSGGLKVTSPNALAGLSNGILAMVSGTVTPRTLTAGTGISITNGDGVAGNPVITNIGGTGSTLTPFLSVANGPGSSISELSAAGVWGAFTDFAALGRNIPKNAVEYFQPDSGADVTVGHVAYTVGGSTSSSTADARGHWRQVNTGTTSGTSASIISGNSWCWIDHEPLLFTRLRFSSAGTNVVTNMRFFMGFWNDASSGTPNNADTLTVKGIGVRFSTVAGDTSLRPVTFDGTTQTLGAAIGTFPTIDTEYDIYLRVLSGATTYQIWLVNRTGHVVTAAQQAIPSGALGFSIRNSILVYTTTTGAGTGKRMEITRIYGENGCMS